MLTVPSLTTCAHGWRATVEADYTLDVKACNPGHE
ncbi:MAG: hypothetical protein JWN43_625 [Gammaproteobacteria bacterium]|nr:hypothetical protein [Gammaproteobacteria bacterium]